MISVTSHQRRYDPGVSVTREADGMGHLKDDVGFFFGGVEQDDGTLKLLQLILNLCISIVYRHIQQQNLLQLPTHKTVLDGAADLHTHTLSVRGLVCVL